MKIMKDNIGLRINKQIKLVRSLGIMVSGRRI
jgi:hypothetical protein